MYIQLLDINPPLSPWYFDRQTWPEECVFGNCPDGESFSHKLNDPETNNCFKVQGDRCPTEFPTLTQVEIDVGTSPNGIEWTCTDANNPRSICHKTCKNGNLKLAGNLGKECICKETCQWESLDLSSYYNSDVYQR